jgi:hypothetical protein
LARIAIDARKLGDLGIGTYIEGIVRGLDRLDEQNDYVLLTLPGARLPKLDGGRIRSIPFASPKYSFQELVRLPMELRRMNAALPPQPALRASATPSMPGHRHDPRSHSPAVSRAARDSVPPTVCTVDAASGHAKREPHPDGQ